jgi:hypothetical protein
MALVHSRVNRVAYAVENPVDGALGTYLKLHTLPGLNHRFRVFRGLLGDEVRAALGEDRADRADDHHTQLRPKSGADAEGGSEGGGQSDPGGASSPLAPAVDEKV